MSIRRAFIVVATFAALPMIGSCTEEEIAAINEVCDILTDNGPNGKAAPLQQVQVGGSATTSVDFLVNLRCPEDLGSYSITASSLAPTIATVTTGTPTDGEADEDFDFIRVPVTVNGVGEGTTEVTVTIATGDAESSNAVVPVEVTAGGMTMGIASFQFSGVPAGRTGSATIEGNGINQTITQNSQLWLPPGQYTVTTNTIETPNNDYGDEDPTQQIMIIGNQTTNVLIAYAIIATLVNINFAGLEAGMSPLLTLTRGNDVRTITANTAIKLAVGLWTIAVAERTIGIRSYKARAAVAATLLVLAQTAPMALPISYYCFQFQWQILATFAVLNDQFGHQPFLQLVLLAHALNILWVFPEPPAPAGAASLIANQTVTQETVTITGVGSFIPVTGNRNSANGAINLTGSGTAAGFPNVPALMTGTLTNAGAFTNVQYRLGQSTPPTGLPGGPITYSMSAPAPSGPALLLPMTGLSYIFRQAR